MLSFGRCCNLLSTLLKQLLCVFKPGEYILKASPQEYKCDAAILVNNLGICLLETSGKLLLKDNLWFGQDHVKGVLGSMMLFNMVYRTYFYATEETASRLKIPFVQARRMYTKTYSIVQ